MVSIIAPVPEIADTEIANLEIADTRALIFRVAGRAYTCALTAVREVVPLGDVTPLPGAPAYVCGLMNVRGEIVTVLDAGAYLHGVPACQEGLVLLVEPGETKRVVGLVVDAVADVRAVRADEEYGWLDVRALVAQVIVIPEEE